MLQKNLTNTHIKNQVKPLQPDKGKDDAAMKACSARENPISHALRIKHSLRGWQFYKQILIK